MPTLVETLKSRWITDKHDKNVGAVLRPHFHRALDVINEIQTKRTEIEKNTHLSDAGRKAKLLEVAKDEAKRVGKAQRTVEAARRKLDADRMALVPGVSDKTDIAAAMRRQEIRAMLSQMSGTDILSNLSHKDAPTEVLAAVLEWPMRLAPLGSMPSEAYKTVMDRITETIMERDSGPAMAAIRDQSEAVELADVAVKSAIEALRGAVAFPHESAFQQWFASSTPKDAADLAAEAAKLAEDSTTAAALALPASARHTLVSSLLAANSDELVGKPKAA